jgi:molybdopterin molybdotransferase
VVSTHEALDSILDNLYQPQTEELELAQSLNCILAEDIKASRDYPPFDRVCMDGIAVHHEALNKKRPIFFKKEKTQAAGEDISILKDQHNCIEIMTGAILPKNTDSVIPYELLEKTDEGFVLNDNYPAHRNIHKQGKDFKCNEIILKKGHYIRSPEIAVLASEGYSRVKVYRKPKVAIISSGNELVEIDKTPAQHQIRMSNAYMLQAELDKLSFRSTRFHFNDNENEIKKLMAEIFSDYELILISGGVSKGKFDLIPKVLEQLGVRKEFHRVRQKPGKPFWFGLNKSCTVFAFPGNPASSLLCYKLYFESWFMNSFGIQKFQEHYKLTEDFRFDADLSYFAQAKIIEKNHIRYAQIKQGNGSGDMFNLTEVDGFIELPAGQTHFDKDSYYRFHRI